MGFEAAQHSLFWWVTVLFWGGDQITRPKNCSGRFHGSVWLFNDVFSERAGGN